MDIGKTISNFQDGEEGADNLCTAILNTFLMLTVFKTEHFQTIFKILLIIY
jgi:hypothetical protein